MVRHGLNASRVVSSRLQSLACCRETGFPAGYWSNVIRCLCGTREQGEAGQRLLLWVSSAPLLRPRDFRPCSFRVLVLVFGSLAVTSDAGSPGSPLPLAGRSPERAACCAHFTERKLVCFEKASKASKTRNLNTKRPYLLMLHHNIRGADMDSIKCTEVV